MVGSNSLLGLYAEFDLHPPRTEYSLLAIPVSWVSNEIGSVGHNGNGEGVIDGRALSRPDRSKDIHWKEKPVCQLFRCFVVHLDIGAGSTIINSRSALLFYQAEGFHLGS